LLHNKASLLDLLLKIKAKRRFEKWQSMATADRSKNKPAKNTEETSHPKTT
jgi:hypothetical protein